MDESLRSFVNDGPDIVRSIDDLTERSVMAASIED